jgi:hypothetical protein
MFKPERPSPPAAPPSAAAPAAGIPSQTDEALPMPAAPFPEAAHPTRQHAIGPKQCRWIIADEAAGADALMCGAPTEPRRSFCAAHCAVTYMKPPEDEDLKAPEEPAVEDEEDKDKNENEHQDDQEDVEQEAAE